MPNEPHRFSRIAEDLIGDMRRIPSEDPGRQKVRPTQALADVVDQLVTKYRIGREAPEDAIRARWAEIVGTANAAYSHAARLESNETVLIVIANHSVVRNELFLHRTTIVEKLRQLPGCKGLKRIHVVAG